MSSTDNTQHVEYLRDLGALEHVPVGTRVLVHEDGIAYTCAGQVTARIAIHMGWPSSNVWIPEHVLADINSKRGWIVLAPLEVAYPAVSRPDSVWKDTRATNAASFLIEASIVRGLGLLASNSARYVDVIVELRQVPGGNLLRLFHISPRTREQRGIRLWP